MNEINKKNLQKLLIIGAGPAGLGCAYELAVRNRSKKIKIIIIDKNKEIGGLSRTVHYKGFYFDIGPHRFYTKNKEILSLWKKTLEKEFIEIKRLTRILYKNKLFFYPIKIKEVLFKLGILESFQIILSFFSAKLFLKKLKPKTFEEWIIKNFGKKLYQIFFKTYTEKVWGIPCSQINHEWAAQRIKNLNFTEVIKTAIFNKKTKKAKSLIDKFYYPVYGAGRMYDKIASLIKKNGVDVNLENNVVKINHKNNRIISVEYKNKNHLIKVIKTDFLFSSMPLTHFIFSLNPKPEKKIIEAAKKLFYRDHITVNLIVKNENIFPDNWIYVHSPEVKMARITNYRNFSSRMLKKGFSSLSIEYFAFKGDKIWQMNDNQLINLAINEMIQTKLLIKKEVIDGFVIRETDSYPFYYLNYKKYFNILKDYVDQFNNLYLIGRGGMYKYNNMDHSLYSGILAARNYLSAKKKYNLWYINQDAEYLEEIKK